MNAGSPYYWMDRTEWEKGVVEAQQQRPELERTGEFAPSGSVQVHQPRWNIWAEKRVEDDLPANQF